MTFLQLLKLYDCPKGEFEAGFLTMPTSFLIPVQKQEETDGAFIWPAGKESCATTRLSNEFPHEEGYILEVTSNGIEIEAHTKAGVFYAMQTLRDYRRIHGNTLSCTRIEDWPDFAMRGVYFDVSRGKVPTVETLKQLIETLAHWKINELQLYIENVFTFSKHPSIGKGWSPMTPEELLELQAHCEKHHMRFVPTLTSFGHFEKILALPEYIHLAELPGHLGYPGGTTLNPGHPGSIQLVKELYDEFLPLFSATQANACGDEPWELGDGASKAVVEAKGKGEVFLDYMLQLHEIVKANGKQMQIWADMVLEYPELIDRFPKDIVMINWEYSGDPATPGRMKHCDLFKAHGFEWIAAPGIGSWNSHGTNRPNAMSNIRSFANLAREHGALGLLNTHWGDCGTRTPHACILHGFAYGAAHAWNGQAVDDNLFTETFAETLFGPASETAALIRTTGETQSRTGSEVYHCLVAAVDPQRNIFEGMDPASPVRWQWSNINEFFEAADPIKCATTGEELEKLLSGPMKVALPAEQALYLDELTLAARMDLAACRKVVLTCRRRGGERVEPQEWAALARELEGLSADFEGNWLLRNKPSRLADNLSVLRSATQECFDLAAE